MIKKYQLLLFVVLVFTSQLAFSQSDILQKAKQAFSIADYTNALKYYTELSSEANEKTDNALRLKADLGIVRTFIKTGKLLKAEELLNSIENKGNSKNDPNFINIKSLFLLQKGEGENAITELQRGIDIVATTKNDSIKAKFYNDIGVAYWNTGRDQQALDNLAQSLSINNSIFDNSHPEIAANYNNMGLVYSNLDKAKALEYYELALAIYEKIYPTNHPSVGNAYVNLGAAYNSLDETLSADYNLKQALSIFSNVYGEEHPSVAFVYNNLGVTSLKDELYDDAYNYHNKALSIYKNLYGNRHQEIANSYNLLGNVYFSEANFRLALDTYQRALIANTFNFNNKDIFTNPPIDDYINVLTILSTIRSKAKSFEALHYSKTLKFKHLEGALTTYEVGDKLIDAVRAVRDSEADKIALGTSAAEIYQKAIELCINLSQVSLRPKYYKEKAFYFSEKNKSAILLSAISDTKAKEFANIPAELIDEESSIKNDIAFFQQQLAIAENDTEKDDFRKRLFEKSEEYNSFITELGQTYPEYYSLKYAVKVANVEGVQSQLDKNTAILSYTRGSETNRMFVFLITSKKFDVFDLPIKEEIETQITLLRNTILWQVDDVYADVAHQLHKQLIPKKIASNIKNLVIIPDGILSTTPFEVFLSEKVDPKVEIKWTDLPFLSNKFNVSYAYSTTLFQEQLNKEVKIEKESIFLCAPVDFEENEGNYRRKGLNSLPATLTEVEKIQNIFEERGLVAKLFLQDEAQEEVVKSSELRKYKYLHFATHGIVDENYPELSQVFLASDDDETHDGDLFSGEIYNLKINADLVTLSACQTGLGKVTKGEGIMGLSRALLFAGANNLVVSLWSVSDESTSELMIDFYEEIAKNSNIAYTEALQKAKQRMIKEGKYSSPYYWAPFILIGR